MDQSRKFYSEKCEKTSKNILFVMEGSSISQLYTVRVSPIVFLKFL